MIAIFKTNTKTHDQDTNSEDQDITQPTFSLLFTWAVCTQIHFHTLRHNDTTDTVSQFRYLNFKTFSLSTPTA